MQHNGWPISLCHLASRGLLVLAALALLGQLVWTSGTGGGHNGIAETGTGTEDGELVFRKKQANFSSNKKLVSVVAMTNEELRNLKRDFMDKMTDIYFRMKLTDRIGYEQARDTKSKPALANVLMAQEFATILIERHIIMRRLFTGLKVLFTKLLPMKALVKLVHDYKSFDWLKNQEQVNVRPLFPGAKEQHFANLYTLIELRGQVRAAEDVVALTSDNLRRILEVAQRYLRDDDSLDEELRDAMAFNAKLVLQYYLHEVFEWYVKTRQRFEASLGSLEPILIESIGGKKALLDFVDHLIDADGLDIDLNQQAKSFEYPPTITEKMILNVQESMIPSYALKSVEEDRSLLLANHNQVFDLLDSANRNDADLYEWTSDILDFLCHSGV